MGLREEKKQATRSAIVDTALHLFREKGFCATRIQDITDRLRISEATFFNYFPTKESVLEAVADGLIEHAVTMLDHEAADSARPVSDRLNDLAAAFAVQFDGDPEFVILLAGNTRYFLGARTDRFEHALALLAQLFAEGQARRRGPRRHQRTPPRGAVPVGHVRRDPELGAGERAGSAVARTAAARRHRAHRWLRGEAALEVPLDGQREEPAERPTADAYTCVVVEAQPPQPLECSRERDVGHHRPRCGCAGAEVRS